MEKKRFNIIDVLIVLVIVVVAFGGIAVIKQLTKETDMETKTILLEIKKQKQSFCDIIKKDDTVYDGVENTKLGKVKNFSIKPAETDGFSKLDGTIKKVNVPERYDIYLEIEAPKDTDVQVGKQFWIETSVYKASGYILGVTE